MKNTKTDSDKFLELVDKLRLQAGMENYTILAKELGLTSGWLQKLFRTNGQVIKGKFYKSSLEVFPQLEGCVEFPLPCSNSKGGQRRKLHLTEKGKELYQELCSPTPSIPKKGEGTQKKSKEERKLSAPSMPITVLHGMLRILKDEKLSSQIIELNDWAKESGSNLGDVLRAAQLN